MIRGLYAAGTGLNAMSVQQDVTARNLANADKPGYLRRIAKFQTVGVKDDIIGVAPSVHTDHTPGPPIHTGNKLDVMVMGNGYFELEGENGKPIYTRNGTFHVNSQGVLVNYDGLAVNGSPVGQPNIQQRIVFPPQTNPSSIEVLDNGIVLTNGRELGQLRVAKFEEPNDLLRIGNTFYERPEGMEPDYNDITVRQGYRAGANSALATELVTMLYGFRQFEASQRAMRSLDDAIRLNTRPEGR